jgi:hypothetical protein
LHAFTSSATRCGFGATCVLVAAVTTEIRAARGVVRTADGCKQAQRELRVSNVTFHDNMIVNFGF